MGEPVFSSCFNRETLVPTMMTLKRTTGSHVWIVVMRGWGRLQAIPSSLVEFIQRGYVGGWKWYFEFGNWERELNIFVGECYLQRKEYFRLPSQEIWFWSKNCDFWGETFDGKLNKLFFFNKILKLYLNVRINFVYKFFR